MNFLSIPVSKHDHILGSGSASCSLVEYGDYECPSCRAFQPIFKALSERFGDQLSLVFRNFPLCELHPNAEEAAEVAELAGSYGSFWTAHDMLYADQDSLGRDTYRKIFAQLSLPDFEHWPADAKATAKKLISADFAGGIRSGVNGTPTLFLNGERCDGPLTFEALANLMDQVLISNGD